MAMETDQANDDVTVIISDDEGPIPNIDGELDLVFRTIDTVSEERKPKKGKKVSLAGAEVIPTTNKGFEMLKKMGYEMGSGLGRCNDGITEPICLDGFSGRVGLGLETEGINTSDRRNDSDRDLDNYFVSEGDTEGKNKNDENKDDENRVEESWDAEYNEPVIIVRKKESRNAKRFRKSFRRAYEFHMDKPLFASTVDEPEAPAPVEEVEKDTYNRVYKVRIVSQNSGPFTDMQYRTLLDEIQKAVDQQESNYESQFPRFHTFKRKETYVFVVCDNKFTLNWLKNTVRTISSMYKNSKLRVMFPKRGTIETFFVETSIKSCYTPGYLLRRIMKQNPKLCTNEWSIESTDRDGMNKVLRIGIDEKSFDLLSKMNFEVFFNLRKIRLKPLI